MTISTFIPDALNNQTGSNQMSGGTEEVIGRVIQGIALISCPSTGPFERKQAHEFLDGLKNSADALPIGLLLLSPAHLGSLDDAVVHFGTSLVEGVVKWRWTSLLEQDRATLKAQLTSWLISSPLPSSPALLRKRFVREKMARVFVEVAKRAFPLDWIDMDTQLQAAWIPDSPKQMEFVLVILRALLEDVFLYPDSVSELRKKELSTGLLSISLGAAHLQDLQKDDTPSHPDSAESMNDDPTLRRYSKRTDYALLQAMIRNTPPDAQHDANTGWVSRLVHYAWAVLQSGNAHTATVEGKSLITLVLEVLAIFISWIPLRCIYESGSVGLLIATLPVPDWTGPSTEALLELFSRFVAPSDSENRQACIWGPFFADQATGLQALCSTWQSLAGKCSEEASETGEGIPLDDADFFILKNLTAAMILLGTHHVCTSSKKGDVNCAPQVPPSVAHYYSFLLSVVAEFPHLFISLCVYDFFQVALKHPLAKTTEFEYILPHLYQTAVAHMELICLYQKESAAPLPLMSTDAWEDVVERASFLVSSRQKVADVLKLICLLKPIDILAMVGGRLATETPQHSDHYLETTVVLLDALIAITALPITQEQKSIMVEFQGQLLALLRSVVSLESTHAKLIRHQLSLVSCFLDKKTLDLEPLLFDILQRVFKYTSFVAPASDISSQSGEEEASYVRRKALTVLVKLSNWNPDALMKYYADLSSTILTLLEAPHLSRPEKDSFREFICTLIIKSNVPEDGKQAALASFIQPLISQLISCKPVFETPRTLLEYLGLFSPPHEVGAFEQLKLKRNQLSGCFYGLLLLLRIKTRLWDIYVHDMVAIFGAAIAATHGIWRDFADLSITQMSLEEKTSVLGPNVVSSGINASVEEEYMRTVRAFLSRFRESVYSLVGVLSFNTAFYTEANLITIRTSLFMAMECLDIRHLKPFFLLALKPIIVNCSDPSAPCVVEHILTPSLTFAMGKLRAEWTIQIARQSAHPVIVSEQSNEILAISGELFAEKTLRNTTRAFAEFILGLVMVVPKGDKFQRADLAQLIIQKSPYLECVATLLSFKDTVSCMKLVHFLLRLLPVLLPTMPTTGTTSRSRETADPWGVGDFFASILLMATLEVLHDGYFKEVHSEIIPLISDIYVRVRPLSLRAYETLAALPSVQSRASLETFEVELASKSSPKEQHAVVRSFLQAITGVSMSELFRSTTALSAAKNPVEVSILQARSVAAAASGRGDVFSCDSGGGGGVLEGLFGGGDDE